MEANSSKNNGQGVDENNDDSVDVNNDENRQGQEEVWQEHIDPNTGNPYYHNPSTGVTTWTMPTDPNHEAELTKQEEDRNFMKRYREYREEGRKALKELETVEAAARAELAKKIQWHEAELARLKSIVKKKEQEDADLKAKKDALKKKKKKNAPKPKQFRFLSSRPEFITASI